MISPILAGTSLPLNISLILLILTTGSTRFQPPEPDIQRLM